MELWIRSQNRLFLTKANNLVLEQETENSKVRVLQTIQNDRRQLLGEYKTKERALEVLDEIQNILSPKYMIRMDGNLNNVEKFLNIKGAYIKNENNANVRNINNTFVYNMPKD